MVDYISEVINRFGGRAAGTSQEKAAQEYTASVLEAYCDSVRIDSFKTHLTAHFESLKIFSVVFWLCLILYHVKYEAAAILSFLNAIFFLGHFVTYRHWLDFLFPKQKTWNVEGVIEPKGEVKNTILIAGHIDSVREFQWWHHFGKFGLLLNTIAGFGFVLQGIFFMLGWILSFFIPFPAFFEWIWMALVFISPAALSMVFKHGEHVVDGALDNLTGVAMAVEMAKVFSIEPLQNTRLRLISFGSEEPALRGAFEYARQYKDRLKEENAILVNFDTIKSKEHLTLVTGEINTLVKFPHDLIHEMEQAFQTMNVSMKKKAIPIGASDGSAFAIEGLPAITIIGMDSENYDPCYHTRLDNLNNLEPEGLAEMKKVLIHFIKSRDQRFS